MPELKKSAGYISQMQATAKPRHMAVSLRIDRDLMNAVYACVKKQSGDFRRFFERGLFLALQEAEMPKELLDKPFVRRKHD